MTKPGRRKTIRISAVVTLVGLLGTVLFIVTTLVRLLPRVYLVTSVLALPAAAMLALIGREAGKRIRATSVPDSEQYAVESDDVARCAFTYRLRTFVLSIVIPMLLALTVVWGAAFYRGQHRIIRAGVDGKLETLHMINSAFVDGEGNTELDRQRVAPGLAGEARADAHAVVVATRTRSALFAVCMVGVAALLIACYFSLHISRQLTGPVNVLKQGALRVAGGDYAYRTEVEQPAELHALAQVVNEMGSSLSIGLKELTEANASMEARKRRYDLTASLDKEKEGADTQTAPHHAFTRLNSQADRKTASGWIAAADMLVFWLAKPVTEPLEAVHIRSDIATIAARLVEQAQGDTAWLKAELEGLFPDEVSGLLVYSVSDRQVHCIVQEPLIAVQTDHGRYADTLFLDRGRVVTLEPNQGLLFSEDERFLDEAFVNGVADMIALEEPDFGPSAVVAALQKLAESESGDHQAMVGVLSA